MAIIKRGILGGFSNKIANVVGSSWKGIPVMRSLPLSVANPNTVAQRSQRSKFKRVSAAASALLSTVVKPLWDRTAQQMSGYNAFIQQNISCYDDAGAFAFRDFVISKGRLGYTRILPATIEDQRNVKIQWSPEPTGAYQESTDLLYYAILNEEGVVFSSGGGSVQRSVGQYSFVEPLLNNAEYYVYVAFSRADGSISSDTSVVKLSFT